MKKGFILSVLTMFLFLTACHTRKVAIVNADSVSIQNKDIKTNIAITNIDTSKKIKKVLMKE